MARNDFYKLYQLSNVLISKYAYKQVLIDKYRSFAETEAWFINESDPHYNLIRITFNSFEYIENDIERINDYIAYMRDNLHLDVRFLDIHISKDQYDASFERFDYLNIEENYSSGKDVSSYYPEIYHTIHNVEDQEKEIFSLARQMQHAVNERRKQYLRQNKPIATNIIIVICTAIYVVSMFLAQKYSTNSAYIFMGASYTTFTLGLRQYYRLLTSGFVHGGFLHLIVNMYSLYFIGSFVERKYGVKRYLMVLCTSIIVGTMGQLILSGNTIILGLSSALYAFMVIFIMNSLNENRMNFSQLLPLIFINLSINFLASTAWLAHIGGLICGYLYYLIFTRDDNRGYIALLVVLIIGLFIRMNMIDMISPVYLATDRELIEMYSDLGLNSYAANLMKRLIQVYTKFGG